MPAEVPFQLRRGDTGPVQQSPVTCGSASLTVARMLASPEFASWVIGGICPLGGEPDDRSQPARFAEHEREVMSRTNGLRAAGGKLNIPWPRALGTPPWGARKELEYAAGGASAAYRMRLLRWGTSVELGEAYRDLAALVRQDLPALLYIGSPRLPRHVTLVLPAHDPEGDVTLDVYDPATGSVAGLARDRFARRALAIAGWNIPWMTIQPCP